MIALVLDNCDPLNTGRVLVSEGWAEPVFKKKKGEGSTPEVGDRVWVSYRGDQLVYSAAKESDI